jgi:hypothetical protein
MDEDEHKSLHSAGSQEATTKPSRLYDLHTSSDGIMNL